MKGISTLHCESSAWRVPAELTELRVVVVGAGKMARLHLQTLKAMSGVRLVAVCNRASDAADRLAVEFGIEQVYHDPELMLRETSPDAAIIAVSHAATCQVTETVLATGTPCLIEKPAAYSAEEAERLASLADASGCLNIVGLNRRYYCSINQAQLAIMQHGGIRGVLVEAHEPLLEYRSRRQFDSWVYDNWMMANTIHGMDLLRMVGGEVARVQVLGRRINEPGGDSFSASIKFESGILGTFVAHSNAARGYGMKIYGEGVTAELYPMEQGSLIYDSGFRVRLRPDWADTNFKPGLFTQNAAFLQSVADRVAARYPASDLRDHVLTLQLIEQIQSGAAPSGEPRRFSGRDLAEGPPRQQNDWR